MTRPARNRDRDVLLLMVGVVGVVLLANVVSAAIPGSDALLARVPVVVLVLIVGTGLVLVGAIRRRS